MHDWPRARVHSTGGTVPVSSQALATLSEVPTTAALPEVDVNDAGSSSSRRFTRQQSERSTRSGHSSLAGSSHVIVHVAHAKNEKEQGQGQGRGVAEGAGWGQDTKSASRQESSQEAVSRKEAGEYGGHADCNKEAKRGHDKHETEAVAAENGPAQGGWCKTSSDGGLQKCNEDRPTSGLRECRICLGSDEQDQMVSACACSGTQQWAHFSCLSKWVVEKRSLRCELCSTPYVEPYSGMLQQELSKHPVRQGSNVIGMPGAGGQAVFGVTTANTLAHSLQARGPRSTAVTNPWGRIDFWCSLLTLLAALIIILYFASSGNWQVIVWGVIVAFVPITAGLSLTYMLVGKAIEGRMNRLLQAEQQAERQRQNEGTRANVTLSPFIGMHA